MISYLANTGIWFPHNRTALKPGHVMPDQTCQVLKRISASGFLAKPHSSIIGSSLCKCSFSSWQSEDILSLLSPRSSGWDRPLSWGLKDVQSCVFAWCFVMLSVKHEFLSSWFGLMCSDCFVSGSQSFSCPLFSGLWNKERDVQLCQGLKSP